MFSHQFHRQRCCPFDGRHDVAWPVGSNPAYGRYTPKPRYLCREIFPHMKTEMAIIRSSRFTSITWQDSVRQKHKHIHTQSLRHPTQTFFWFSYVHPMSETGKKNDCEPQKGPVSGGRGGCGIAEKEKTWEERRKSTEMHTTYPSSSHLTRKMILRFFSCYPWRMPCSVRI